MDYTGTLYEYDFSQLCSPIGYREEDPTSNKSCVGRLQWHSGADAPAGAGDGDGSSPGTCAARPPRS